MAVVVGLGFAAFCYVASTRRKRSEYSASSPGKVILFGEHAVVYHQPALAIPLSQVRTVATVRMVPGATGSVTLCAPDLREETLLSEAAVDHSFAAAIREVAVAKNIAPESLPAMTVNLTSSIPIASGLGSGAAAAASIIRAFGRALRMKEAEDNAWVSDRTYQVEKIHHGTPSGIDNTVVAFEAPVFFLRGRDGAANTIETFRPGAPLHLLVANTGIKHSTKEVVADVRRCWEADKTTFQAIFELCGEIAREARVAIEAGDVARVGELMNRNQEALQRMGVSCPELENLVAAARENGALGAKLSGGGRGGNMVALAPDAAASETIQRALLARGATSVLCSVLS